MTWEAVLGQALAMLQRCSHVTYRTLQRQFKLDDAALEDLKDELLYAPYSLNPNILTLMEKTRQGSYYGSTRSRIDRPRLLDMYMDGKLKIDELVSCTFTLEQVNAAYEVLQEGEVV